MTSTTCKDCFIRRRVSWIPFKQINLVFKFADHSHYRTAKYLLRWQFGNDVLNASTWREVFIGLSLTRCTFLGLHLGQVTSSGHPKSKGPKQGHKFPKSQNNWYRLNMFKATEVERKRRKINLLLINMQKNLLVQQISQHVYPLEIIQTNSMGSSRKNPWNTMTACIQSHPIFRC